MNERPSIAVIDDNIAQRTILSKLLETSYHVEVFSAGNEFLAAAKSFDLVLLDIEMPGLNGYETCRMLRQQPEHQNTPVLFVSGHDTAPERVAAYEAGGDDFLTKPISADELRLKIDAILQHQRQLSELAAQSTSAQQVAFTAMISMGDLGVVIDFLRKSAGCSDYATLAEALCGAMQAWGLKGAVQIRGNSGICDRTTEDKMSALQSTVLDTMKDIGRIFEMGTRVIINYSQVSLLVENLPIQDPDKVGRFRDHLAVLAEGADLRISTMDAVASRNAQQLGIHEALANLRTALARTTERAHANRSSGQIHMLEALEHLAHTLNNLGLTDIQSAYINDLVKCTLDDVRHYFDEAAGIDTEFSFVLEHLEQLAHRGR